MPDTSVELSTNGKKKYQINQPDESALKEGSEKKAVIKKLDQAVLKEKLSIDEKKKDDPKYPDEFELKEELSTKGLKTDSKKPDDTALKEKLARIETKKDEPKHPDEAELKEEFSRRGEKKYEPKKLSEAEIKEIRRLQSLKSSTDYACQWQHIRSQSYRAMPINVHVDAANVYILVGDKTMVNGPLTCAIQEPHIDEEAKARNSQTLERLEKKLDEIREKLTKKNGSRRLRKQEVIQLQFEQATVLTNIALLNKSGKPMLNRRMQEARSVLNRLKKTSMASEASDLLSRIQILYNHSPPIWIREFKVTMPTQSRHNEADLVRRRASEAFFHTVLQDLHHYVRQQHHYTGKALSRIFPPLGYPKLPIVGIIYEFAGLPATKEDIWQSGIFGTNIVWVIMGFCGPGHASLLDIFLYVQRHPMKICFPCGYIRQGCLCHAALKGSRTNGVMALPRSASIRNPCPFCGEELHIDPPEFNFKFSCPLINENGDPCGDTVDSEQILEHLSKHINIDESLAETILSQYEDQYELWRKETRAAAPPLFKYSQCNACEAEMRESDMQRCKGCHLRSPALYCGPECQRKDWIVHKQVCERIDKKQKFEKEQRMKELEEEERKIELESRKPCNKCNIMLGWENAMRCKGCDPKSSAFYCSQECARKDWKAHKKICARLDKLKSTAL